LAEDTVCIKEHLELSQQQLLGPEAKTTRRFQVGHAYAAKPLVQLQHAWGDLHYSL